MRMLLSDGGQLEERQGGGRSLFQHGGTEHSEEIG